MKVSLNWLRDYVKIDISTENLCNKLTMAGMEVEKLSSVNGDPVIEMEITPNRPDCLNVIGIAREISAILNVPLKMPVIKTIQSVKNKCSITIEDKQDCSRYIGTVIENVKCTGAPKEITIRITALGMRPVSNIVDITNFCMMEMGQPMHAFDYDKLKGSKVIVRRAKKGEKIVTIDEVERYLDPSVLVIADAEKPVAIAGIMGGKETEVSSTTKNILLESAYFDPILIRRTSRALGLSTDSSYRFERGVDMDTVAAGSSRALELILDNAGGKIIAADDAKGDFKKTQQPTIDLSIDQVQAFLGTNIKTATCKNILNKLGFAVSEKTKDSLAVKPPCFRQDISREVDLYEEISRIIGYDNLPMSLPLIKAENVPDNGRLKKRNLIKRTLLSQGFDEVLTFSLVSRQAIENVKCASDTIVTVANPLTQEQELMRPDLLTSMMPVALVNINRGQKDFKFFEAGRVYSKKGERESLGIMAAGSLIKDWRVAKEQAIGFFDIKGTVEKILETLKITRTDFVVSQDERFEQGQRSDIKQNGKTIGVIGKLDADILASCGIKQNNVFFAELNTGQLFSTKDIPIRYDPLNEYPSVVRDISLAIKKDVAFSDIKNVAENNGGAILSSVEFKEEYLGEKIEKDKRGLVFSLTYQSADRTLTEEEVNTVHQNIVDKIISDFEAIQR